MANITNREGFAEYCLRALGKPVINIDVTDEQVDDRIADALTMYAEYHFDGSERVYLKHEVKPEDKERKYITLPDNIIGAVRVFPPVGMAMSGGDMFDIRYQIAMNDLYNLTTVSMVPYVMTMTHLNVMNEILIGQIPIRSNRRAGKIWLDMDWDRTVGKFLLIEAHQLVDPEEFTDVWNEHWLKKYATALIKRQWGANLGKFKGMTLPGGMQVNGGEIYLQALNEIEMIERELKEDYTEMPLMRMA